MCGISKESFYTLIVTIRIAHIYRLNQEIMFPHFADLLVSATGVWEQLQTTGSSPSTLQDHTMLHYQVSDVIV